jgi:hypothetical protein
VNRCTAILAALLCAATTWAQGSRRDDVVFGPSGHPMAGATVTVCTTSATGTPCSPLAQLFTDATLTVPASNPFLSDSLGNFHFYATPGRYQVQISGPGIVGTITYPDVILPNDPSSPSFNSVTASGAISALTLSLGGNLTVGGSATVNGSLTVAGGPVPSTAAANNWSAPQSFSADAYFRSGVPWYDVKAFCASGSTQQTTGTISQNSTSLALASAIDFANCPAGSGQSGEGVYVYHAGAPSTMAAPTGLTVTATGATGSTTYSYQVSTVDALGGQSAATAAVTITNGNATLSSTNYNLICWTPPANATGIYVIYGRTGSAPLPSLFTFWDTTPSSSQVCYHDIGSTAWAGAWTAIPDVAVTPAPTSATNDWLETTISSGAGTTTLTLAASAARSATSQIVKHSDTSAIQAATNSANTAMGGLVHFPLGGFNFSQITFPAVGTRGWIVWKTDGQLNPMQTISITTGQIAITGGASTGQLPSFDQLPNSAINPGYLNPAILINGATANPVQLKDISSIRYPGGDGIVIQNGANNIYLDNVHVRTGGTVLKVGYGSNPGGFGLFVKHCTFDGFANATGLANNSVGWTVDLNFGQVYMHDVVLIGHGMHCGACATDHFEEILTESLLDDAFLTWDTSTAGNGQVLNSLKHIEMADNQAGGGQYLIHVTGNNTQPVSDVTIDNSRGWTTSVTGGTQSINGCTFIQGGAGLGTSNNCSVSGGFFRGALFGTGSGHTLGSAAAVGNTTLTLSAPAKNGVPLILQAIASQTGDFFDVFSSGGSNLGGLGVNGIASFQAFTQPVGSTQQSTFGPLGNFVGGTTLEVSANNGTNTSALGLKVSGSGDPLFVEDTGGTIQTFLDNAAAIHTAKQFISTLATGTAPFSVSSTTPVANLTASNHPTVQDCGTTTTCSHAGLTGTQIVKGTAALTAGSTTVTGISPAFTSSTSFVCTANDNTTATNLANAKPASASSITLTGTGTDTIAFICVGS